MGFKRRMIAISNWSKTICFYFLQNVCKWSVFWANAFEIKKSDNLTRNLFLPIKIKIEYWKRKILWSLCFSNFVKMESFSKKSKFFGCALFLAFLPTAFFTPFFKTPINEFGVNVKVSFFETPFLLVFFLFFHNSTCKFDCIFSKNET